MKKENGQKIPHKMKFDRNVRENLAVKTFKYFKQFYFHTR